MVGNGASTSGDPLQDNMVGVSTKLSWFSFMKVRGDVEGFYLVDMLLHPMQSLPLIQKPCIQITVLTDLLAGQKPEGPNAVVEIDENDIVP